MPSVSGILAGTNPAPSASIPAAIAMSRINGPYAAAEGWARAAANPAAH